MASPMLNVHTNMITAHICDQIARKKGDSAANEYVCTNRNETSKQAKRDEVTDL